MITSDVFAVQRCWFDGPQHPEDRPVDCWRLFPDASSAVEVASHSAHLWALSEAQRRGGEGRPPQPVRTILLPPSHARSTNSPASAESTFAFATCGKLFWVRRIVATHFVDNAKVVTPFNGAQQQQLEGSAMEALAATTEGVIGGTGYPRRGREYTHGCVVLLPRQRMGDETGSAQSDRVSAATLMLKSLWLHTVTPTTDNHQHQMQWNPAWKIVSLPVGRRVAASFAPEHVLQDWPDSMNLPQLWPDANINNSHKRMLENAGIVTQYQNPGQEPTHSQPHDSDRKPAKRQFI